MARVSHDKAMKDMVIKVKELCKDVDDNSIQILLQQYDFNFEQTVQAILDGSAEETLCQWKSLGSSIKTTAAKKKKKNKNKNSSGQNLQSTNGSPSVQTANHVTSNASGLHNGGILSDAKGLNGSFLNETDPAEPKESRIPMVDQPSSRRQNAQQSRPKEDYKQQTKKARDRTLSEASTSSGTNKPYKGPHAGLEKSLKDLQRQTVSLQRLKVVLNEQVDKAFKRISEVFKELHNQLNEREAQLIFAMDKAKTQANDVLEEQQLKALELKHQTDRAQTMKESEVGDLRSRIKFFVSERKHFEDLSHAQRFVCDFSHILEELRNFGEVVPIKTTPDRRVSVASLGSQEEVSLPEKPSVTATRSATATQSTTATPSATAAPLSSQSSLSTHQVLAPVSVPTIAAAAATTAAKSAPSAGVPAAFIPNSSHVLMQSESLTKYEATEMAQRLANLSLGDSNVSSTTSSASKSPRTERGRGSRNRGSGNARANSDQSAKVNSGDQQRDAQSTRGRGRGGRGRGRSNRGHGEGVEGGSKNESLPNDNQRSSQSKDINARPNVNSDEKGGQGASSKQAQAPKSPGNNPRRGGRRGGRRDNLGGQASGNSMAAGSGATAEPTDEATVDRDRSHRGDKKSSAAADGSVKQASNKVESGDLTNGEADALPQRGSRSDRRGGGRHRTENQSLEAQEPVLANGE